MAEVGRSSTPQVLSLSVAHVLPQPPNIRASLKDDLQHNRTRERGPHAGTLTFLASSRARFTTSPA